jgi:hypothetical protein
MVAALLIGHGMREQGLELVKAVRARHDGPARNPFNEPECGHHYARALSSWAAYMAWIGLGYSAVTGTLSLNASPASSRSLISLGDAWGTCRQTPQRGAIKVSVELRQGRLRLSRIVLRGRGELVLDRPVVLEAGKSASFVVPVSKQGRRRAAARS